MLKRITNGPFAVVAIGSLVIVLMMVFVGGGIAGSYALMVHYVTTLQAEQHAAQTKNAVGLCKAIQQMDLAGHDASFSNGSASAYGHQLAAAIHQLYISSRCPAVISKGG